MNFLDTNYLVRFITNDIPDQAQKAKSIVRDSENIYIAPIVLAETVYILENHYKVVKNKVCWTLSSFLRLPNMKTPEYFLLSFKIYERENVSFYDSLLIAETIENQGELHSFDKKLVSVFKKYCK